jgi:hypothetical protein
MALSKIGTNSGTEATRKRLNIVDPGKSAYNLVFGQPGVKYPEAPTVAVEGTLQKLIEGHNAFIDIQEDLKRRPF